MPSLLRRAFTDDEARSVASWAYRPPFDLYNVDPSNADVFTTRGEDGAGYYPAVDEHGAVVAFCVFGAEARVRGQQARTGVLDVGLGVRPDVTSQGRESALLYEVADLAHELFRPRQLRTAVATFNGRSLALCRKAGFTPVRDFTGPGGRSFRELARDVPPQHSQPS